MKLPKLGHNVLRPRDRHHAADTNNRAKVTVLVAEDDEEMRKMLALSLELEGFVVQVAANGAECVSQIRRSAPDILLLDLVLPWINGLEVLATVRSEPRTKHLPVIVATGTPIQPQNLRGLGPAAILHKPFGQDRLLATIGSMLRQPAGSSKVRLAPG